MPSRPLVTRRIAGAIVLIAVAVSGCAKRVIPVSETDWRGHLNNPAARVTRNWVLADNTMLVELGQARSSMPSAGPEYEYEVYNPQSGASKTIVPVMAHAWIRKVGEHGAEFVCDDGIGLQYLTIYDLASRQTSKRIPAYSVQTARQFGLTNTGMVVLSVRPGSADVQLKLRTDPRFIPNMKVFGDDESGTVFVQLPGMIAPESVLGTIKAEPAPGLVESVTIERGVAAASGKDAPGLTLRIETSAQDSASLTYSLAAVPTDSALEITLQLSSNGQQIDLSPTLGRPVGWSEWPLAMEQSNIPIGSVRDLVDGTVLVELGAGASAWHIWDPVSGNDEVLISDPDCPVLDSVTDREVTFLCESMEGGSFPYLKVYDIASRSMAVRDVYLDLETPIEFGGPYSSVYGSSSADRNGVAINCDIGPVMAGGGGPPLTRVWADETTHSFFVEFPGEETKGVQFGPIDCGATPHVQSASVVPGVRGEKGTTAPGVTLCLVLDATKWPQLTYSVSGRPNPDPAKADMGCPVLVLTFADDKPAKDISGRLPH